MCIALKTVSIERNGETVRQTTLSRNYLLCEEKVGEYAKKIELEWIHVTHGNWKKK